MGLLDALDWEGKIFIGGEWVAGGGGDQPVVEVATSEVLGRVGVATLDDVATATEHATKAQVAWAALPFTERARILRVAGGLWEQHADEVSDWHLREAGSIRPAAEFGVSGSAQECYEASALPSHPLGEILPTEQPRLSLARRIPVGVVGVIAPFNAPLVLAMRSIAPALALGNAVILKPDPRTAVSGGVVIAAIFEAAGLPAGVLQVVSGGREIGEAIVTDPAVPVISFTGSTAVGRRIGELAGKHLKRAHLELGGNSSLLILEDADVEDAVNLAAWGSFLHQGQICMATGRHLVAEPLYDDFVEQLTAKAANLPVGDPRSGPVALGPLIDAGQRDRVHEMVTASVEQGAKLMTGGTYEGLYYRPTVLADTPLDAPAFADEVFGPVAPVTRIGSLDEAAALAASSEYGLSLGIVTRDVMKGLAIAERIPTGIVHINDQTVGDEANAPFGGTGASGTGSRFGGAAANIDAFTEVRWITVRGDTPRYPF